MSERKWNEIHYDSVPSIANARYSQAFRHHDAERYYAFLRKVQCGEKEMHAGQLFPYEILRLLKSSPETAEALWKSFPRESLQSNVIPVIDRSGSMIQRIAGGGNTKAKDVADSLGLLFSEQLSGEFKNSFITFSATPVLWHLNGSSLAEKYHSLCEYGEFSNTDIEAVFDLILDTAVKRRYTQEQIPDTILILSDMEFDAARDPVPWKWIGNQLTFKDPSEICIPDEKTLFGVIRSKWHKAGYQMPRLIFWNICSRTCGIAMARNEGGLALISGFSPHILQSVLSGDLDPWKNLLYVLNQPRYKPVEDVVMDYVSQR